MVRVCFAREGQFAKAERRRCIPGQSAKESRCVCLYPLCLAARLSIVARRPETNVVRRLREDDTPCDESRGVVRIKLKDKDGQRRSQNIQFDCRCGEDGCCLSVGVVDGGVAMWTAVEVRASIERSRDGISLDESTKGWIKSNGRVLSERSWATEGVGEVEICRNPSPLSKLQQQEHGVEIRRQGNEWVANRLLR